MSTDFQLVQVTGLILEEQTELSLDELVRTCAAQAEQIMHWSTKAYSRPSAPRRSTGALPAFTCNARVWRYRVKPVA
jgi:hypothetical protein